MTESGITAYRDSIGVAITLTIVLFALSGKGHPEPLDYVEFR